MSHSVGKTIKSLRSQRGLSQEELAEKINKRFGANLNKGMISKWENDLGDPRLETVRHMAVFFNVTLDFLLGRKNDTVTDQLEDETYMIARKVMNLNPEKRRLFNDLLNTMGDIGEKALGDEKN